MSLIYVRRRCNRLPTITDEPLKRFGMPHYDQVPLTIDPTYLDLESILEDPAYRFKDFYSIQMENTKSDFDLVWEQLHDIEHVSQQYRQSTIEACMPILKAELVNNYGWYESQCIEYIPSYVSSLISLYYQNMGKYQSFHRRRSSCPFIYINQLKNLYTKYQYVRYLTDSKQWQQVNKIRILDWGSYVRPLHEYVVKTFFTRPHMLRMPGDEEITVGGLFKMVHKEAIEAYA